MGMGSRGLGWRLGSGLGCGVEGLRVGVGVVVKSRNLPFKTNVAKRDSPPCPNPH